MFNFKHVSYLCHIQCKKAPNAIQISKENNERVGSLFYQFQIFVLTRELPIEDEVKRKTK